MTSPEMQQGIEAFRARIEHVPTDLGTRREMLATMISQRPVDPGVRVEEVDVGVPAEWVWTDGALDDRVVLYFHGGGYTTGSPAACRPFIGLLSRGARTRFLALDYRLAPEHPFPAAVDDAVAGYRWLLDQGFHPHRIAFGGDSAGGGLALGALAAVKDEGLPLPRCAFAISPWTDMTISSATMLLEPSPDPMGNLDEWRRGAAHYLGGGDPRAPYASPLFADLRDFPPIHIEVGTAERLLDDSRGFGERARRAGAAVEVVETEGALHCFPLHLPHAPESVAATERLGRWLDQHLGAAAGQLGDAS